jgi:hypothetical protein
MNLPQADMPRTGIVTRMQAALQTLSFDDKVFCTMLLIVGAVMATDCITNIVRKYQSLPVYTEPFGTTQLQREGLL